LANLEFEIISNFGHLITDEIVLKMHDEEAL